MRDSRSAAATAVPGHAGFDYLIVGAGFAGSVLAERLANVDGKRVLIVDKRPHIGGNAYDRYDDARRARPSLRAAHLPHQFGRDLRVPVAVHRVAAVPAPGAGERRRAGRCRSRSTSTRSTGSTASSSTSFEMEGWFASVAEKKDADPHLRGRGGQQGRAATSTTSSSAATPASTGASTPRSSTPASPRGCRRAPTATTATSPTPTSRCPSTATRGCSRTCCAIPNIKVMLNTDYREVADLIPWGHMIYTGPIDAFFNYRHGKLPYRSLEFHHVNLAQEQFQQTRHGELSERLRRTRGSPSSSTSPASGIRRPRSSTSTRGPMAIRTTRCPRPENATIYKRYEAEAEALSQRHLRRPARDLQVLQHGPGRRPGAGDLQAAAQAQRAARGQAGPGRQARPAGLSS